MRRNKWLHLFFGVAVGVTLGLFLKLCLRTSPESVVDVCPQASRTYAETDPLSLIGLNPEENISNSNRTLVFVGVMTAQQYLETRARAVYETWAKELPGKLAFFSSEVSRADDLPLVSLPGVDDSYPPQKKSFMMLLYMYENFGDRFEWFMRADDDVYVRGDKLEEFLRSVDSRKPFFIGQAGRGTAAELGTLSLGPNENFCMGGPGVLISRETLRRVAPHVKYCLRHLYTTHEDVELGRCIAKFAGVSCTWSYDMQVILHHNTSGEAAYSGQLRLREVHRAITLHPVKDHSNLYRLHAYFQNFHILDLRDQTVDLHREIASSLSQLGVSSEDMPGYVLPWGEPLFPKGESEPYLGDVRTLGAPLSLTRFKPDSLEEVLPYEFVTKSVYSVLHANPKRRIETPLKEALDDVIREVMEIINAPSRQRGRVIEFNELLYGYTRLDPLHGADHILDLLLQYKRYRGRKMTVPVRRHAYLQQSFTGTEIRELPLGEIPSNEFTIIPKHIKERSTKNLHEYADFDESSQNQNNFIDLKNINIPIKEALENGLMKLQSNLPKALQWNSVGINKYANYDRRVHFILTLAGRHDKFVRFMKNYEDIVLKSDETATLIVILYLDGKSPLDYRNSEHLIEFYKETYPYKEIKVVRMGSTTFSRGAALTEGVKVCDKDDLLFFIDVDMMFNHDTLTRVRIHTVKYYQMYFPIVFSEYHPKVVNGAEFNKFIGDAEMDHEEREIDPNLGKDARSEESELKSDMIANLKYKKELNDDLGYFRHFGFGILSVFKTDFERFSGFNLSIKGWGLEDTQLFETMIRSNISVYRAADDSLIHKFHPVNCDKNLDPSQYKMCLGTKASTLGGDKHMTYYMLNHPRLLWPPKDEEKGAS